MKRVVIILIFAIGSVYTKPVFNFLNAGFIYGPEEDLSYIYGSDSIYISNERLFDSITIDRLIISHAAFRGNIAICFNMFSFDVGGVIDYDGRFESLFEEGNTKHYLSYSSAIYYARSVGGVIVGGALGIACDDIGSRIYAIFLSGGISYRFGYEKRFKIFASIRNIGPRVKADIATHPLPHLYIAGFSYRVFDIDSLSIDGVYKLYINHFYGNTMLVGSILKYRNYHINPAMLYGKKDFSFYIDVAITMIIANEKFDIGYKYSYTKPSDMYAVYIRYLY